MNDAVIYVHGRGGSASEAERFRALFPAADVIGFDYKSQTPQMAKEEFPAFFDLVCGGRGTVSIIANSIGAYYVMHSLADRRVGKVFFISPVVDMENLIRYMMRRSEVTEDELRSKGEIKTSFGETLSWEYLSYVRAHPIRWDAPTRILYGGRDGLVSRESVTDFALRIGAKLTVMEDGEHWFHTPEQLAFLESWITE